MFGDGFMCRLYLLPLLGVLLVHVGIIEKGHGHFLFLAICLGNAPFVEFIAFVSMLT